MSLQVTAQMMGDLVVEEMPMVLDPHESGEHVVIYPEQPNPEVVLEMHEPQEDASNNLEVSELPSEVQIVVSELPGVEALDPAMEEKLEVQEDVDLEKADDSDSKKSKIAPKWDWQSKGAQGFVTWVKERCDDVPKHSGYDTAGVERAISYLEKLDGEISKAMRMDLDGELDANKIEEVRSKIDEGIERLHDRLSKINKKSKKKKKSAETELGLVKEGQKATHIGGMVVTVPLLVSGLVRICINGSVSAGHDIEDMFKRLADKYKLTSREKFECLQLFADMGYPMRRDRGFEPDEDVDETSSDNFDWAANYQA